MFENLLKLAADDDKATLEQMAKKYPTLKTTFELGEKLETLQGRLKTLAYDDPEPAVDELEKWRKFKATDWPAWQETHTRTEAAYATAQERIAELENLREAEVTPDEIKKIVSDALKENGVVTKAEVETSLKEFAAKEIGPTLDSRMNGLTSRFEDVFDEIEDVIQTHQSEFKEKLRPKAVFDYMKEHKISSAEAAYKQMTAGRYQEKSAAQIEADKKAEFERGKKEATEEARKANLAAQSGRTVVDGKGGSAAPRGALMRRAMAKMPKQDDGAVDTSKIPLGKGIARAAAQEYYDKQAAAVTQ